MEDILKRVIALLRADPALATLTGATSADSRVYLFYRGGADVTVDTPGFVTVSNAGEGSQGAVVTPSYTIVAWARTQDVAEAMAARVRGVLHKKVHVTDMARVFYSKQVDASDRFQPQSNFASKTLQYSVGWLEIGASPLSVSVGESVGVGSGF